MNKPLISIIVPIYNTEKFLNECINSILGQSYTNIEVLLVNNGSTDTTPQICDDYGEKDERVKVIHKQHGSISSGRNAGIKNATGEYYMFVDSDDILAENMILTLYKMLVENESQIAICKSRRMYCDKTEDLPQTHEVAVCNQSEALYRWICKREFGNEVWAKMYCRSCVEGELFPDMQCEDMCYLFNALQKADRIAIIDSRLYKYRMHRSYDERSSFRRPVESEKPQVYTEMISAVKNKYPDIYDEFFAACCEDELSNIMKIHAAGKVKQQKEYLKNIEAFYKGFRNEISDSKHIKSRSKKLINLFCDNKLLFKMIFDIRNIIKR